MVDRMLDLVREELETGPDFVDKTFLEPAAGDGNFLVAILRRKLAAIEKRYPAEKWPHESLFALASIYGVELLEDNHQDAKAIMLAEFLGFHEAHGVRVRPAHEPAQRRGLPHRHEHHPRQHPDRARPPRDRTSSSPGGIESTGKPGMVQREPFTLASLRGATASTSPSTTAIRRAGSTRSTRRCGPVPSPKINTFREIIPLIYSWMTPDIPKYDGLGEDRLHRAGRPPTSRIAQQASQLSVEKKKLWARRALFTSEAGGRFTDTDFHAYLKQQGVEREIKPKRTEWHHFAAAPKTSLEYFNDFAGQDFADLQARRRGRLRPASRAAGGRRSGGGRLRRPARPRCCGTPSRGSARR